MESMENIAADIRTSLFDLGPKRTITTESTPSNYYSYALYEVQPCRYKSGCNKHANVYADLCSEHAVEVYGCEIKESTIPSAGHGLFAVQPFDEGDVIDLYEGKRLSETSNEFLPYGFHVKEHNCAIDAKSTQSCITRYINNFPEKANCAFIRFKPNENLTLVTVNTTRKIASGEELFINYGSEYNSKC